MMSKGLVAAVMVVAATSAWGQEPLPAVHNYVGVKLGAIIPEHSDLDGFDTGLAFEFVLGHQFSENLAIEGSVGRFSLSGSSSYYDSSIGQQANVSEEITAVPISVSLKPILPSGGMQLYGLIGISLYSVSATATLSSPGYQDINLSDKDSSVGIHVGAGISAVVSPQVQLAAEAKYIIGSAKIWGTTNHFDSLVVGASASYLF